VLDTASVGSDGDNPTLNPLENRSGWVNPEDLTPMPQCIAQQDQSTWLSTMTKCTGKQCTRHFGAICTHHQWETQLTCLNTEFSSDVLNYYLPYCSRSVLAKAQLYLWIHSTTGRTWLVHFGDANGLQNLSPASLAKGYAAVSVIDKAPTCLTGSVSALSMERFQHVIASCSFTSTTQHTGNAARPWEYRESLRSMVAMDVETVGYNLTHRSIGYGRYFDKACFCGAFTIDTKSEPCPGARQIDLTRERLWIHATCGSTALPDNWTDMIKVIGSTYIPIEDWHWPACVTDMPKQVTELTSQCATDACELDASGYCKEVRRTVDRACFCRNISYDSCGGSCRFFETRIAYLKWLHGLCGCGAFTIYPKAEPCPGTRQIDLMRERLWMNATCGPMVLPDNWTDMIKISGFAYIPIEDWHWPACVTDMPKQVTELTSQCATDACKLDVNGYCKEVKRTVDRACFCRNISYDSCGGSCHFFETRKDYVKWLHDLCGSMQDWHGLPDNWRQLAAPTPIDMIPWRWTIKPLNQSNTTSNTRLGSIEATLKCTSNEWKLRSFALVNIAPFLAGYLSRRTGTHRIVHRLLWHPPPWCWFFTGILIAALQLLANWFVAFIVQQTPGYEDTPVFQLMLFFCSLPRLSWLTILLIGVQPFEAMNFSAAASTLFAEMIIQFLSSYYMIMTINYGREHCFYLGGMEGADREGSATMMYTGALLWLIIIIVAFVQSVLATRRKIRLTGSGRLHLPKWQRSQQATSTIVEELIAQLNEYCTWIGEKLEQYWIDKSMASEESSLMNSEGGNSRAYGTLPVRSPKHWATQTAFVQLYLLTVTTMLLLWIAQWLFLGGFITLSSEEYVFMHTLDPC
jgi:hypothetical protein